MNAFFFSDVLPLSVKNSFNNLSPLNMICIAHNIGKNGPHALIALFHQC